jgi:hypothetical protein
VSEEKEEVFHSGVQSFSQITEENEDDSSEIKKEEQLEIV